MDAIMQALDKLGQVGIAQDTPNLPDTAEARKRYALHHDAELREYMLVFWYGGEQAIDFYHPERRGLDTDNMHFTAGQRGHIFIYFDTSERVPDWKVRYFQGGAGHAMGSYETDEKLIEALHKQAETPTKIVTWEQEVRRLWVEDQALMAALENLGQRWVAESPTEKRHYETKYLHRSGLHTLFIWTGKAGSYPWVDDIYDYPSHLDFHKENIQGAYAFIDVSVWGYSGQEIDSYLVQSDKAHIREQNIPELIEAIWSNLDAMLMDAIMQVLDQLGQIGIAQDTPNLPDTAEARKRYALHHDAELREYMLVFWYGGEQAIDFYHPKRQSYDFDNMNFTANQRGHIFIYFKISEPIYSERMHYWETRYFQGSDSYETDEMLIEALNERAKTPTKIVTWEPEVRRLMVEDQALMAALENLGQRWVAGAQAEERHYQVDYHYRDGFHTLFIWRGKAGSYPWVDDFYDYPAHLDFHEENVQGEFGCIYVSPWGYSGQEIDSYLVQSDKVHIREQSIPELIEAIWSNLDAFLGDSIMQALDKLGQVGIVRKSKEFPDTAEQRKRYAVHRDAKLQEYTLVFWYGGEQAIDFTLPERRGFNPDDMHFTAGQRGHIRIRFRTLSNGRQYWEAHFCPNANTYELETYETKQMLIEALYERLKKPTSIIVWKRKLRYLRAEVPELMAGLASLGQRWVAGAAAGERHYDVGYISEAGIHRLFIWTGEAGSYPWDASEYENDQVDFYLEKFKGLNAAISIDILGYTAREFSHYYVHIERTRFTFENESIPELIEAIWSDLDRSLVMPRKLKRANKP